MLDIIQQKDIEQLRRELETLIVKFKPVISIEIKDNKIAITIDVVVRSTHEQLELRSKL